MAKRPINTTRNEEAWGYRTPWYRVMNFFQKRFRNDQDLQAKLLEKERQKNQNEHK